MLEHLSQHGNINIAAPLYLASLSFGANLQKAWRFYVTEFSWLEFNKADLRGQAIGKAEFTQLWTKGPGKMNVDGAKAAKWYDAKSNVSRDGTDYAAADSVKRFFDRTIKALIADNATGADGKRVTLDTVKKMIAAQVARMEEEVTAGLKAKLPVSPAASAPVKTAIAKGHNVKPKAQPAPAKQDNAKAA